jgi:hypothetical protein
VVASLVISTSPTRSVPYLSLDMMKYHTRRGVQLGNLAPDGDPAANDAALMGYIEEASSWMDSMAEVPTGFAARIDTVSEQVNIGRDGYAVVTPRMSPTIGLLSFAIGGYPGDERALESFTGVALQDGLWRVPIYSQAMLTSSQGPIQFGGVPAPWAGAWALYSYVAGYPVTYLTDSVAAGAVSMPVLDTTGIVAGRTWLTAYAGRARYTFLATSVSTADSGGLGTGPGLVGCAAVPADIPNGSDYPVMVSALPQVLIQVCALATRGFIKTTGAGNVSSSTATGRTTKNPKESGDDLAEADKMLRSFLNPVG